MTPARRRGFAPGGPRPIGAWTVPAIVLALALALAFGSAWAAAAPGAESAAPGAAAAHGAQSAAQAIAAPGAESAAPGAASNLGRPAPPIAAKAPKPAARTGAAPQGGGVPEAPPLPAGPELRTGPEPPAGRPVPELRAGPEPPAGRPVPELRAGPEPPAGRPVPELRAAPVDPETPAVVRIVPELRAAQEAQSPSGPPVFLPKGFDDPKADLPARPQAPAAPALAGPDARPGRAAPPPAPPAPPAPTARGTPSNPARRPAAVRPAPMAPMGLVPRGEAPKVKPAVQLVVERPSGLFTQGLLFHRGRLYESTGLYGRSAVRIWPHPLPAGVPAALSEPEIEVRLPDALFGEGLAAAGDRLWLLTWREGVVLGFDPGTLAVTDTVMVPGEAWGLAFDGRVLWLSDGSHRLHPRRPSDFAPWEGGPILEVHDGPFRIERLNELEFDPATSLILANVWGSPMVAAVDPADGAVRYWLDLSEVAEAERRLAENPDDAVLNGLAIDELGRLWVTGKLWPRLYLVAYEPPVPPAASGPSVRLQAPPPLPAESGGSQRSKQPGPAKQAEPSEPSKQAEPPQPKDAS